MNIVMRFSLELAIFSKKKESTNYHSFYFLIFYGKVIIRLRVIKHEVPVCQLN